MSKAYINKIKVFLNQSFNEDLKGYIIDNNGVIYFSDSYGIIKLFDDKYTRGQRLEIINNLKKVEKYQLSIIGHFIHFQDMNFNIPSKVIKTIKEDKKIYNIFENNNKYFDYKLIKRINKIIGKNEKVSYYVSNKCQDAICIVGQYGMAFLLGCRTY